MATAQRIADACALTSTSSLRAANMSRSELCFLELNAVFVERVSEMAARFEPAKDARQCHFLAGSLATTRHARRELEETQRGVVRVGGSAYICTAG